MMRARSLARTAVIAIAPLFVGACGARGPVAAAPIASTSASTSSEGAALLDALEHKLTAAHTLRAVVHSRASGALSAHLDGTLTLGEGGRARFDFAGEFEGKPARASMISDGVALRIEGVPTASAAPPKLHEGVLVAFVRMGLLHNLSLLVQGQPPGHVDGTVRSWVTVAGATVGPIEPVPEMLGLPGRRVTFGTVVRGKRTGGATLWLDPKSGLPLRRELTVHFPEGDMRVVEIYERLELDVDIPPATFAMVP